MSTEVTNWFSATELSLLGEQLVAGLPKTMQGCKWRSKTEGWKSRRTQGRGGPGGMRTEYQPPTDVLALIHAFLQDNPDFFGEPKIRKTKPAPELASRARHIDPGHAKTPYGFILVPRYNVTASMGHGSVIHSEQIVDHLAFKEEWIRTELSTNPKNLVLISAIGDSMEPTLRAGDLLLIDCNGAGVTQDAIYAFAANGELRVKRMQLKIDGSVVVKSDNPKYEEEILVAGQIDSLRIIGRVVWSGRRM